MALSFDWSDYILLALLLVLYSLVGIYQRFHINIQSCIRKMPKPHPSQKDDMLSESKSDSEELFLGGRRLTLFPVVSSIMVSFLSSISLLGTASEIYFHGVQFLLMILAYCIAFPLAAELYLPVFYCLNLNSVNEYLELRFHSSVRFAASMLFCFQMFIYLALALYAPALVFSQVTGLHIVTSVVTTGLVATFYTALGGIRAVVWTDVLQMLVLTSGLLFLVIWGVVKVGGLQNVFDLALKGQRLQSFVFDPNPLIKHTIWTLPIGGAGMCLSIYATNQTMVQRYLACKNLLTARRAILLNIPMNSVFLVVQAISGLVIYAYLFGCDPLTAGYIKMTDEILPYAVMKLFDGIPVIRGLFLSVIVAAALSTMSSGVNSIANVFMEDLLQPLLEYYDCTTVYRRRKGYIAWFIATLIGLAIIGIAFSYSALSPRVLRFAFSIFGGIGGPILALFTVGILLPCVNTKGAISGLVVSMIVGIWLIVGSIVYPTATARLPLSTDLCNSTVANSTRSANPTATDGNTDVTVYSISYLYLSLISLLVTLLVSLLVSTVTGFNTHQPVPRNLLAYQYVKLSNYFPQWLPPQTRDCIAPPHAKEIIKPIVDGSISLQARKRAHSLTDDEVMVSGPNNHP